MPAALAFGALVQLTGLGQFLVGASAEMEMHELGHATALWLAGRLAIPLPMITISPDGSRSRIAFVIVAAALAVLGHAAWKEKLLRVVAACALLGVALVLGTLFLDGDRLDAWVKFAGVGGELWLSALAMLAFHEKLPAMLRWAQARWFFMVWGALAYAACARRWIAGDIPWGSFWGGDGDMDTLRDSYGWSAPGLVHAYRWIAAVCLVLVLARVLWLWGASRESSPLSE
ncbi:MAG: hypothetical protein JST54_29990 [Deltaproteobacteria bacterium]|nr:hypothetical protein [Deltaproteobacteria bacterium]